MSLNVHHLNGNLLVGSSHFYVDTLTNKVGITTTNPDAGLHVNSNAYVNTDFRVGADIAMNVTSGRITAGSFEGDGSLLQGINSDSGSWVKDDANSKIYVSDTSHRVGIGTATPRALLDVSGPVNVPAILTSGASATEGDIAVISGEALQIGHWDDGTSTFTNRIHINGSGNVGVGTDNPSHGRMQILCNGQTPDSGLTIRGGDFSAGLGAMWVEGSGSGQRFNIQAYRNETTDPPSGVNPSTADEYAFDICLNPKGGNCGVGTSSPVNVFEVLGTNPDHNTTIYPLTVSTVSSSTTAVEEGIGTGITFRVERQDVDQIQGHCGAIRVYGSSNIPSSSDQWNMSFLVRNNDTINEPMTIKYNGNIGLGTTDPQKLLHIKQTADTSQGPGNAIRIEQDEATPEHFDIGIDSDTTGAELYIKSSATTGGFLAVGGDASYVYVPKIFFEDGLSTTPTTISGAVQRIQVNAGHNNGFWQTTARGGMALGTGDDSLLLGCGDKWDEYNTGTSGQNLEDENLRLACDGHIHLHPSLQSGGYSTTAFHRFNKNNHYLQDSGSTFDSVYTFYRDYSGSIYKVGAGNEGSTSGLKLWSDNDIYLIESDDSAYVFRFDVNYDKMYVNGSQVTPSDDRLKFNETRIENATDTLMKLDPQLYDKKRFLDSNVLTHEAGFIAQDVWYDVPEFRYMVTLSDDAEPSSERPYTPDDIQVDPDWEGSGWGKQTSHLNYDGMIPYIIKSIQEIVTELPLEKNNVLAEGDLSGLIVSTVTGKLTDENKPILTLSNVFCDKACFGVVSDSKPVSRLDPDSLINVNGIGNVWVIYTGSSLTPGDYVTTSNISGYGQLQPDDIARSYTVAKIIQHCDFSEATRQKRIVKQKLADVNYYVKTNYIDITEEEYNSLHEERRVSEEQIYYEYETIHRVEEGEPYDFVKINPEITLEAYEILSSEEKKKYKVRYLKRVIEESPDEPKGHDTFEKKTRTIYKRIVKQYYNTKSRYRELEVRRELVNDLDEHGQLQWEDSGETEKVYKVRYLLPNGTQISEEQYTAKALANEEVYIAAFVACTYHCG